MLGKQNGWIDSKNIVFCSTEHGKLYENEKLLLKISFIGKMNSFLSYIVRHMIELRV